MSITSPITAKDGLFAGEDKTLSFTIYDAAGALKNITGWTLQWKLEPTEGAAATLTKAGTITDGLNGRCSVAIAAADTAALAAGTYWHVLSRTDAGNNSVLSCGDVVLQSR